MKKKPTYTHHFMVQDTIGYRCPCVLLVQILADHMEMSMSSDLIWRHKPKANMASVSWKSYLAVIK